MVKQKLNVLLEAGPTLSNQLWEMLDREETGRNRENRLHCLQLKYTCNAGVRSAVRRFNFISRRDGRAMIDNAAHIFCCNFFSAASPLAEEIN